MPSGELSLKYLKFLGFQVYLPLHISFAWLQRTGSLILIFRLHELCTWTKTILFYLFCLILDLTCPVNFSHEQRPSRKMKTCSILEKGWTCSLSCMRNHLSKRWISTGANVHLTLQALVSVFIKIPVTTHWSLTLETFAMGAWIEHSVEYVQGNGYRGRMIKMFLSREEEHIHSTNVLKHPQIPMEVKERCL